MRTEHRDQASFCCFALREMYCPSQTPRLAVSSNRITREHVSAIDARAAREGGSLPHATLRAWLEKTVTAAAKADGARVPPHRKRQEVGGYRLCRRKMTPCDSHADIRHEAIKILNKTTQD
ncbi:hypothetical protein Trydic_g15414 [Trypoxylus dichotomus]